MLPVLKEAGVVDSGGQGLVEFLKGTYDAFMGKEVELDFGGSAESRPAEEKRSRKVDSSEISTADIKFGYCTEFIIMLEKEFSEKDELEFKEFLMSIGDSIVCVSMDDIVKVHVHTNHPGEAFEKALTFGSLTSMKIDNMREEHNEKLFKEENGGEEPEPAEEKPKFQPKKEFGFVSVCVGEGLANVFKGLSVDYIIEGGQTMNPSTEDIVDAIDHVNADTVFVLPNNGNIIMAAQQAEYLCEGKKIIVVPTKTITQGINAVINYAPGLSAEENLENMIAAASDIKTAEITYAVRDTEIDGLIIHNGDYMGIGEGHMLAVGTDMEETVIKTIAALSDEDSELITIYYGSDTDEEKARHIVELLEEKEQFEDIDFEVVNGGQPVYYYIISVE